MQASAFPRPLSAGAVTGRLEAFLSVGRDLPGEYWTAEHFLADRPGKWEFSRAVFDPANPKKVLAYAFASRPEPSLVHLHHLMVACDHRGRGLGRQLLTELSHRAALAGVAHLRLKVHPANHRAAAFYLREGFQVVGEENGCKVMTSPVRLLQRLVGIHQPNYLPWCGYFAKSRAVDVFVFLDDAQMPGGQSYVSRTRIAGAGGPEWLTVPVERHLDEPIQAVRFAQGPWTRKHLGTLRARYGRRPHFKAVFERFEPLYACPGEHLAQFNMTLIASIWQYLGLHPVFQMSSQWGVEGASDDRLINLVRALGGTVYVSGKGGANYQDPRKFEAAGIRLEVQEYRPVPYDQGREPFEPGLSIVDLLFNVGLDGRRVLLGEGS
ncbi:MAG: WbqC family protein [Acidobacteria bacterium]|nr:WbqC family protein [Acidobacteriota bacterium]